MNENNDENEMGEKGNFIIPNWMERGDFGYRSVTSPRSYGKDSQLRIFHQIPCHILRTCQDPSIWRGIVWCSHPSALRVIGI